MSRTTNGIVYALLICAAASRPAMANEGCSLKQVASLPMHYVNNRILVDVETDDAPVSFLIDTGADYSEMGRALAARLHLPVLARPGATYGATGAAEISSATVRTLRLGRMVAHNQPFFVDDNFGDGQDRRPAGIFGADFLGSYDFEIDFAAEKLNLYLHDHCPDRVVYWANEYFKIPFSRGEGTTPRINISVSVDGHPLRGILDTGAYNTAMRLATARAKLDYDDTTTSDPTVTFSGAASTVHRVAHKHRFSSLEFGPITLRNPLIDVSPIDMGKGGSPDNGSHINSMRAEQPEIIVGMDVISKLHLYVDYADSALYFTLVQPPHAGP